MSQVFFLDVFFQVAKLNNTGIQVATEVLESWAKAEWFLERPALPEKLTVTIFKVLGETNTDDLSPAPNAWSRPDIPLHALSMFKNKRPGLEPLEDGSIGPLGQLMSLKKKGFPLAFTGEVVGTGSSRKSASNSVLWHMGEDIPYVPNIKRGGICLAGKIAPIFYNTLEDSGALPIELDVSSLQMGDVVDIYPYQGKVFKHNTDKMLAAFELKTGVVLDEVRAGGRIPLIIGRSLTTKARKILGLSADISDVFHLPVQPDYKPKGFTLAQKIVGKACGTNGVVPGQYCEPHMSSVGSQDTTGPMTRDELRSLACIKFSSDLVMQSFCHTAAYPKLIDVKMHQTLPDFFHSRGGIALRPGDGIIHAWLNRMVLPDAVGTGGDSHTRFPIGISFPAGSGLVAFAAATGIMPLDMPESVLVKFSGTMQPGIALRDLVQAIPYTAIQKGLLTIEKKGKKNIFSGRILEIEGLSHLQCEQAFELSCAAAERSAAACTVKLNREPVVEFVRSNVTFLKWMISMGYGDEATLRKRIAQMEDWLTNPILLQADSDAEYAAVIEINMDDIKEPVLALPNDPDACALLSEKAGTSIDEAFVGSCMTNISHFRVVSSLLEDETEHIPARLWLTPPTKMDNAQLRQEGSYGPYCAAGARTEIPGCSLCMGNQARCKTGTTIISTSTRNFPNRLGQDTKVYLGSAAVTTIAAILGRLPTVDEYMQRMKKLDGKENEIYCYLRFDQMPDFNPELNIVTDKND